MKKLYSTILMLAMMVTALSFTACGSDGDDDDNGGNGIMGGKKVSVILEKAGTLSSMIPKSQASELLRLKISGHMDARDFDFIKWDCMNIEEIDLSEAVIDSYSGVEGTEEGNNKTYAADEIPSGAFFYWINSHKYIYDGMPTDEGMASIKKIVLPQSIKAIRRNAFARAYNLTEINIPEGVESIDYVAFAICTSLEELRLPASLSTVGKQAFADMKNMKRLYVAATTPPSAESNSFQGMTSNAVLYVPSGTEDNYRTAVGWNTFRSIVGIDDFSDKNTNAEKDDDDKNSGNSSQLKLKDLKGTWTTVAVTRVPSSKKADNYMYFTFNVYWDEGYHYESGSDVGVITLENSVIYNYDTPIMDVLSFDGTSLKVKVAKLDGAVVVMKKLGTLTNDDYKSKLIHGVWYHSFDSSDEGVLKYKVLYDDETVQSIASSYGNRFQFFQFAQDGTGIYRCGHSGYIFEWHLSDKKLTIKTSAGANMASKLTLIGIEGFVYFKFEKTFNWYGL